MSPAKVLTKLQLKISLKSHRKSPNELRFSAQWSPANLSLDIQ